MNPPEPEMIERQLFDRSPIAMAVLDIETGCCIDCNKAVLDILHLKSKVEVLGKTPLVFSAPVQYDGTFSQERYVFYRDMLLFEDTVSFEWRCRRADGEVWDAEVHLRRFGATDHPRTLVSFIDITQRKIAERMQSILHDLTFELNACTDLRWGLARALDALLRLGGIDCGAIYTVNPPDASPALDSFNGSTEEFISHIVSVPTGSSPFRQAMAGTAQYVSAADLHERNDQVIVSLGLRAFAVIPIVAQGTTTALLTVASHASETLSPALREVTESIALQIGAILLRLHAADALLKEKRIVEALLDNLPTMFFLYDGNLRLRRWNRMHVALLGYSDEELEGMPIEAWHRSEEAKAFARESLQHVIEHHTFSNVEVVLYDKQDRGIPFLLSGVRLDTEEGPMVMGAGIDITDRKMAEDALKRSEEKFRAIFNATFQYTGLLTREGTVLEMNKAALDLFNLQAGDVVGRPCWETKFFSDDESVLQKVRDAVERSGKGEFVRFEIGSAGADSGDRVIDFSMKPIYGAEGEVSMLVAEGRDITEIKKTEQLLTNAQKLDSLGVLAGGIAHDFNNLLTGIYGYLDLFRHEQKDPDSIGYLDKIVDTMNRAKALTQQLLTFAKGGTPIRRLTGLRSFIMDTASFALSGSNVSCQFAIAEDLWACIVDKNQIGQVIDNLVINAKQSMPNGGTIEIRAENHQVVEGGHALLAEGAYIKIAIRDHGCGIRKEILPRIFDPFFTTKNTGSGLGLASCYSIVRKHKGCMEVESEPGLGSTFFVFLPASNESATMNAETSGLHKGSGTFIIMDDEEVVRNFIMTLLAGMGYTVVCMRDGREALEYYNNEIRNQRHVAAMLCDLTIPGGTGGKEVIAEIRKVDKKLPVFVASGYSEDPILSNPVDYGFTASISKPFTISDLSKMLNQYM